jgi:hypothetical protein
VALFVVYSDDIYDCGDRIIRTANYWMQPYISGIYKKQPQIFNNYEKQLSGIRVSILGQFIGYFSNIRYLHLLVNTVQI